MDEPVKCNEGDTLKNKFYDLKKKNLSFSPKEEITWIFCLETKVLPKIKSVLTMNPTIIIKNLITFVMLNLLLVAKP